MSIGVWSAGSLPEKALFDGHCSIASQADRVSRFANSGIADERTIHHFDSAPTYHQ